MQGAPPSRVSSWGGGAATPLGKEAATPGKSQACLSLTVTRSAVWILSEGYSRLLETQPAGELSPGRLGPGLNAGCTSTAHTHAQHPPRSLVEPPCDRTEAEFSPSWNPPSGPQEVTDDPRRGGS